MAGLSSVAATKRVRSCTQRTDPSGMTIRYSIVPARCLGRVLEDAAPILGMDPPDPFGGSTIISSGVSAEEALALRADVEERLIGVPERKDRR